MKKILLLVIFQTLYQASIWCQAISLSPATRNPNNLSPTTPSQAGLSFFIAPSTEKIISNTQQSVYYTGTSSYWASVYVALNSGTIPTWMGLQVSVPAGSWFQELLGGYGISQGTVDITNYNSAILNSIWRSTQTSRVLTLSVNILDFSQIVAGTYPIQLRYTIGQ